MELYKDKKCEENSSKYHTGKECVENNCDKPAGTAWSPYFCVDCNIKRMEKIDESLRKLNHISLNEVTR